jgi:hypothetical protein
LGALEHGTWRMARRGVRTVTLEDFPDASRASGTPSLNR